MTEISLHVKNIGGIEELETTFNDGVTLISGPNASNKTSLLRSLAFALGTNDVPIRSGTSRAEVTLSVGDRSITRTAKRAGTGISVSGEPWMDVENPDALASFATLLEFNPLRTAVRNGQSFEETLKRPLNLDALKAERSAKITKKREIQDKVKQREGIESELQIVRDELESKRDKISDLEDNLDTLRSQRSDQAGTDDELERLREKRADLVTEQDTQRRRIENTEDAISRFEDRLSDVEQQLEDAQEQISEHDIDELQSEKEQLERQIAERRQRVEVLQSVMTANREMLNSEVLGAIGQERSLMGDTYTCWTCGQSAEKDAFEDTVDELVNLIEQDQNRLSEHEPQIQEIKNKLETARKAQATVRDLRSERREIENTLKERRESLETQQERLREIESELEDLTSDIEEYERELANDELGLSEEIEEIRVTLQMTRNDVSRLEQRQDDLQAKIEERDELETQLEEIQAEITELTEQIENTEREIRELFNGTMEDLVDLLGFDRIQRVWLDGDFELVIAREVDGSVQHESVDHLAESERELIGLVLGMAGYLTYDLSDHSPMLALDSLGAFDTARAQRLVEYFADITGFVVVAVHPERASELDFSVSKLEMRSNVEA